MSSLQYFNQVVGFLSLAKILDYGGSEQNQQTQWLSLVWSELRL